MADLKFHEAVEVAKLCRQQLTDAAIHTADYARAAPGDRKAWLFLALLPPQDGATWDAANRVAQWHLRSGVPMPRELAEWIADVLEGKQERPRKPGRPTKASRDLVIVSVVQALVEHGGFHHPERNKAKSMKADAVLCCAEGGSACDAVGVAFGIEKYGTVEKVWRSRRKPTPEDASLPSLIELGVERLFLSYQMPRNT